MSKNKQDQKDIASALESKELTTDDMREALISAIKNGDRDKVKTLLIDKRLDPNFMHDLETPLTLAITRGKVDIVQTLVDHGANVDLPNPMRDTPLSLSIHYNNKSIYRILIDKVKNVNVYDTQGLTPLIDAIRTEKVDIVRDLIKKGADVNFADKLNNKPLDVAMNKKMNRSSKLIVQSLLESGASTDDVKLQADPKLIYLTLKLSDPDLKLIKSVKDGLSKSDTLDQKFGFTKKKEEFMSKIKNIELSKIESTLTRRDTLGSRSPEHASDLFKYLGLDIAGLDLKQIYKLADTGVNIIRSGAAKKLDPQVVKEKLAEELIIKIEKIKIKKSINAKISEEKSVDHIPTPKNSTQGKSR